MCYSSPVIDFKGMQKTAGKYGVHGKPRNVRLHEISTPSVLHTNLHEMFQNN